MNRVKSYVMTIIGVTALATGSGCLLSFLSNNKVVNTGVANPSGFDQFVTGAQSLGCKVDQSDNGNTWVDCPGDKFGVDGIVKFGIGKPSARKLMVGCDSRDEARCDRPINTILASGGKAS